MGGPALRRPAAHHAHDLEDYPPDAAPALELALLLEQLREANTEFETASRHKSEFLAAMSHELRTPLNSILGFAQLLLMGRHGELGERQHRYVDNIHTSGHHLLRLIDGVLDLSKIEAGRIELIPEMTSPRMCSERRSRTWSLSPRPRAFGWSSTAIRTSAS